MKKCRLPEKKLTENKMPVPSGEPAVLHGHCSLAAQPAERRWGAVGMVRWVLPLPFTADWLCSVYHTALPLTTNQQQVVQSHDGQPSQPISGKGQSPSAS